MKYIDADLLRKEIEQLKTEELNRNSIGVITGSAFFVKADDLLSLLDTLQEPDMGEVSDGCHTFNELYYYRMLYNAAFFNLLPKGWVHKSKKHHTGEECFGGGWFIVVANLPTGQISNHYELKYWDLFQIPEKETADEWDGHTPQEAAERLHRYLTLQEPEFHTVQEWMDGIKNKNPLAQAVFSEGLYDVIYDALNYPYSSVYDAVKQFGEKCYQIGKQEKSESANKQEPEVDLEEEIVKSWKVLHSAGNGIPFDTFNGIACHFAEWGAKNAK